MKIKVSTISFYLSSFHIVSELDLGEDKYDSETFTESDITQGLYESSVPEIEDAKSRYQKLKEGSENYKVYRNEVDKKMLLPRRMGFQSEKEKKGYMFLKSFYIGDRYADAFSKGIKDHMTLKKINLSRCGLKDEGFIKIIQNTPFHLEELDVSENSQLGQE